MLYETYIAKSRYARYIDSKKRRENWDETVVRYFDFMQEHLKEKHNYDLTSELRSELQSAIVNFEVMPSMRSLMIAGKALERDNTAGYNCFSVDTQFVTDSGIKSFDMFTDGESTKVLSEGKFRPAIVKNFGKLALMKLTVKKGKYIDEIYATNNHRWITVKQHGSTFLREEVVTENLKPGMFLKKAHKSLSEASPMQVCNVGIMHGMVYGDGTAYRGTTRITLCGDSVEFKSLFSTGVHSNPHENRYTICNLPWNWKQLASDDANKQYIMGFLMGWFGADGSVGKSGSNITISNKSYDALLWFKSQCAKLGIFSRDIKGGERINPFNNTKTCELYTLDLFAETVPSYFFLKELHKNRFANRKIEDRFEWKVISVEETDRVEDVWCVQVPQYESFTLSNGIETKNCSYLPVDDPKSFDEAMFILLCGTGVGFSVERQYIAKLPEVPEKIFDSESTIVVSDSKEGWAKALRQVIAMLYSGEAPKWDVRKVRAAGTRLKTFGGRASGPGPLVELFKFVVKIFKNAQGRKLNSIECHDIMCKVGEVVVVGGVRRSAMISLSNLSDDRMRNAKTGSWWETQSQRALANNSACHTERPDVGIFMQEWLSLYESKSGERGIFNREAAKNIVKANGRRNPDHDFGTNPCSEIILRPYQFCNLTEIIVRAADTQEDLLRKIRIASILGTFQSTLTHFPYLRKIWRDNTEQERLLGVSMTGILDNGLLNNPSDPTLPARLEELKARSIVINAEYADILGIPVSTAITAIKPSGTVSQLTDTASGIHPRHAEYYYRRIRGDIKDPLTKAMMDAGVPSEPDVMKPGSTMVFTFPKKAPSGAILRSQLDAIRHLHLWLVYQHHYCEHKPSVTISVNEKEWPAVGAFVWEHFDEMSGVSFLPYDGGNYKQAPYEDCTKEEYEQLLAKMPSSIDWDGIIEMEDNVEGSQMLACTAGGGCEI